MTTNRDIVRRALRTLGALRAGKEPSGSQAQDGLEALQGLLLDLPGLLKNGRWRECAVSLDYTAKEGERLTVTGSPVITLPTTIAWPGSARPPRDLAKVQILGAATNAGLWLWSASKGAWGNISDLEIEGDFPLGQEDEAGTAAMLAIELLPDYGDQAQVTARTMTLAQEQGRSFRSRLKKSEPIDWSRPEPLDPMSIHTTRFCDYY